MIKIKDNWIYLNKQKKPTGQIINGTYKSIRYPKKHFYIKGQGYPIANEIIRWLIEHGIFDILIVEKCMDGDKYLKSDVWAYMRQPLIHHEPYEKQRCLPKEEMEEL